MTSGLKDNGCLEIDQQRIEYRFEEPECEADTTIVLLHEGLGCAALWKDFPRILANTSGCNVFAYSRLGYGQSSPCSLPRRADYMHVEAGLMLPRILAATGIQRFILMGHSDGGSIATIYAGSEGASLRNSGLLGVVAMAPHFFVEEISLHSIQQAGESFAHGALRSRLLLYHGKNVDCAFKGWHDAWLSDSFNSWNITSYLANIKVPLLVMQGALDQYGTRAQLDAVETYCVSKHEEVLLQDCGHAVHVDQTEQLLYKVSNFIKNEI